MRCSDLALAGLRRCGDRAGPPASSGGRAVRVLMGGIVRQQKGRQALKDEYCSILDVFSQAATRVHPRCKGIDMVQNENE
ncbi:hypothetical protein MASR2M32_05120 [Sphaerotilus sulfidivorans]